MEADLAFRGHDFRDFWVPGGGGSRLSFRRLFVLARALPAESVTWQELNRAREQAINSLRRGRRDHYAQLKARQEADGGGP